ncbi:MAG: hypothetical protein ACM3U2_20355 [Deltaproteobacteria bacterium]
MTSDEVLRIVETYWAGIQHAPPDLPDLFDQARLEKDTSLTEVFREDLDGLPLRNGFRIVSGRYQLPPGGRRVY